MARHALLRKGRRGRVHRQAQQKEIQARRKPRGEEQRAHGKQQALPDVGKQPQAGGRLRPAQQKIPVQPVVPAQRQKDGRQRVAHALAADGANLRIARADGFRIRQGPAQRGVEKIVPRRAVAAV